MAALRIASGFLLAATAVSERNDVMSLVQMIAEEDPPASSQAIEKTTPLTGTLNLYDTIHEEVYELIRALPTDCGHEACPRGEFAACILHSAGHDFMDYDGNDFGGLDGCVLPHTFQEGHWWTCRAEGSDLTPVWEKHKHELSFPDFIVISAEAAMMFTRGDLQPPFEFRSNFRFGRRTVYDCANGAALPSLFKGCAAVERVFMTQLGLTPRTSAALMGVHTLGRAHVYASGFDGWWTDAENSAIFNNAFYSSLLLKGWAPEKTVQKFGHNMSQWGRVGAGSGKDGGRLTWMDKKKGRHLRNEMMMDTDICLAYGDVADNAREDDCCAWIMPGAFDSKEQAVAAVKGQGVEKYCGVPLSADDLFDRKKISEEKLRHACCDREVRGPATDCGDPNKLKGIAASHMLEFAADEAAWVAEFQKAWKHTTEVGAEARAEGLFTPHQPGL